MVVEDLNQEYLRLLAEQYPSIQAATAEIVNLTAILQLPKGTEHFLSDIHGEQEAFLHVLKSGSGAIRRKIDELFSDELSFEARRDLATLVYYPEQKLPLLLKHVKNKDAWYRSTLFRLFVLCRLVASKYPRSAVREAIPDEYDTIIEEMLHEQEGIENKVNYYRTIMDTIISIDGAKAFIVLLSKLIQRLAIDRLHIIGDVYDRGPGAHVIMDALTAYHSVDFQWGNHDIVWMGAAAGSEACIANVIRMSLRYANLETLENGYAISLLPLASFAMEVYEDDPCQLFSPKITGDEEYTENEQQLMARMHKAITVIQLKVEGQIIQRRPEFQMTDRLLLERVNHRMGTVFLNDQDYPLLDRSFPTVDPSDPYRLSLGEQYVIEKLRLSFENSEKLQKHSRFLLSKGSMYRIYNDNLLYHGCIPMKEDRTFAGIHFNEGELVGRAYMDYLDRLVRQGFFASKQRQRSLGLDIMWYLWSGAQSPLFGKNRMATFERYFLQDPSTHTENLNPYYQFRDMEETATMILKEFGLESEHAHIINGHVPVKVKRGEHPAKAGGKLLVIDGGFSKAYQAKTGIAGYTLIYNSHGLLLTSHFPFESTQKIIDEGEDIRSRSDILETNPERILVKDTDEGRNIQQQIDHLRRLLETYRSGELPEK